MPEANEYRVVLESRGSKFCIYYNNSAIYCKIVAAEGISKESILIDSVYGNFYYTKSQEDDIYLLCQGRNRNYLLFTHDGEGWHMEELYLRRDLGSIVPLGVFALNDGIHIIYAKKLSLEFYFDLFHLKRTADGWIKNPICEMYSRAKEFSLDIKMTGYDTLHLVSTMYNGETSSLYYYNYTVSRSKWINMPIVNLNHSNIYVKMLTSRDTLSLLCHSFDNGMQNIYYFSKELSKDSTFFLMDIIKLTAPSRDLYLVMDINCGMLKVSYFYSGNYFEYIYNIDIRQWENSGKIPLSQLPEVFYTKIIDEEEREVICSINDELEIALPGIPGMNGHKDARSPQINSIVQEQIDQLCQEIETLNAKINQMEEKIFLKFTPAKKDKDRSASPRSNPPELKESNFKERFMKYKPVSLKLENTTVLSGETKDSIIMQNSFDRYDEKLPAEVLGTVKVRKPAAIIESLEPEDIEHEVIETPAEGHPDKSKGILKTLAEWFK